MMGAPAWVERIASLAMKLDHLTVSPNCPSGLLSAKVRACAMYALAYGRETGFACPPVKEHSAD